jgi:Tfp pilus assembly protein PilV
VAKVRSSLVPDDGFSLIETLVATGLLVIAVVTLAQLFGIAVRSNVASRDVTYATVLAVQKLEELRAIDTEFIDPSPPMALSADTPEWVDYVDRFGRTLEGENRPRKTAYLRRWCIDRTDIDGAWMVQVRVVPASAEDGEDGLSAEEVRLVTVRSRRTW